MEEYKYENQRQLMVQVVKHFLNNWRDARAVEWDGLENRCTGNCTEGSNPSLSATMGNGTDGYIEIL